MIVDLNLKGRLVIIVGAGGEGLKKVNSLLTQDCQILVISDSIAPQIERLAKQGKIDFKKTRLDSSDFLNEYDPILVMATTNNKELNRKIIQAAKKKRCYSYASDDPEFSDFTHPSVINIHDTVQVAISTGGRSPAMARKLKMKAEKIFNEIIDMADKITEGTTMRAQHSQTPRGPRRHLPNMFRREFRRRRETVAQILVPLA